MSIGLIMAIVVVAVLVYGFYISKKQLNKPVSEKVKIVNDANFSSAVKEGISLVDCWAEWCQPCKILNPIISDLADEIGEKVNICKLNVDHSRRIAGQYGIRNIPTILFFKDGREVSRLVGVKPKGQLLQELKKIGFEG
jgi:thioredoxin 1